MADDPFFQLLKNNRTAREVLIKPGEEFTVERVLEKALRQDVGPDPSLAMNKQNYKFLDINNPQIPTWEYKKKYRDRDPLLGPEAYYTDYKMIERRQRQFDYDCTLTFIIHPYCSGETCNLYQQAFVQESNSQEIHEKNQED